MSPRLLLVLALAAPLLVWRLDRPGFSDTEGMFAEPAREMVTMGDWITPRMNGEPFLTKPPLMYWLPASVFALTGPTEYARLWPALAALGTIAATGALGCTLFGEGVGIAAAVVLTTSEGFLVEARLLRADMVLVLAVTVALLCYAHIRRGAGRLTAMVFWLAIGIGVLDKGLLAVLLPGGVIALAEMMGGELRPRTLIARLGALRAPLGVLVVVAVALPWHLLAGLRNPGFLWDYFVNQHLLFFFDAKLPRDSIPDTLSFFWGMFFARALPWSLFLPAACVHAFRARHGGERAAVRLLAVWLVVVLGFFSLAASRLEHYSLPASPAVALLVGFAFVGRGGAPRASRLWLVAPAAIVGALALGALARDPGTWMVFLDPSLSDYHLDSLLRPTAAVLAGGLLAAAMFAGARRGPLAVGAVAATGVVLFVLVQVAHERVEPLFSWRPFAQMIRQADAPDAPIFFRAEDEYQLCGGLEYYTRRRLSLLAPPGWVAPTFLVGHTDHLFTPRSELERSWQAGSAFLVSDDVDAPGGEASISPGPYVLVARAGARVLLRPAHQPSGD